MDGSLSTEWTLWSQPFRVASEDLKPPCRTPSLLLRTPVARDALKRRSSNVLSRPPQPLGASKVRNERMGMRGRFLRTSAPTASGPDASLMGIPKSFD